MLRRLFAMMTVLAFTVFCAEGAIASESHSKTENIQVVQKGNKNKEKAKEKAKTAQKKTQMKKQNQKKNPKKKK